VLTKGSLRFGLCKSPVATNHCRLSSAYTVTL